MIWKKDFLVETYPNSLMEIRTERGYTKARLETESKVSRITIRRIEYLGQGKTWKLTKAADWKDRGTIYNTVAEALASALKVTPQQIFPHYETARLNVPERDFPFSTIEERNEAIKAALPEILDYITKNAGNYSSRIDRGDLEDIAYQTLINVADRVFREGIPRVKDNSFTAYVIKAIVYEWRDAWNDSKKIKERFEDNKNEDGKEYDIYSPIRLRELHQGNVENIPMRHVTRRETFGEFLTELRNMNDLLTKYGL
jgi:hypothetical protein